jgi:tetratricopeptide (TPR) repeat protein
MTYTIRAILISLPLIVAGCASTDNGPRIDNVPMYGQPAIPRPDFLRAADANFVAKASAGFGGDRKVASKAWSQQGEKFLEQRNLDFAMRRYNQAWLLDSSNYEVYWGFGRIMVETDRFEEGVRFLKEAIERCDDPVQIPAVYSGLGVAYGYWGDSMSPDRVADRTNAYAGADEAFATSVRLDPKYGNGWKRWSISLATRGRFGEAAEKAKVAESLGSPVPAKVQEQIHLGLSSPR